METDTADTAGLFLEIPILVCFIVTLLYVCVICRLSFHLFFWGIDIGIAFPPNRSPLRLNTCMIGDRCINLLMH